MSSEDEREREHMHSVELSVSMGTYFLSNPVGNSVKSVQVRLYPFIPTTSRRLGGMLSDEFLSAT